MNAAFAPAQLPIAPKPLPNELISSWLLRTAAANAISLAQLLDALCLHYPAAGFCGQLDYSVPEATLRALSHFTRVHLISLRELDLNVRVFHLNSALLLRFEGREFSIACPRGQSRRVRYAFCPQCLAQQKRLHVRWDWCFVALVRCAVHRTVLLEGCPQCGDADPLDFSRPWAPPIVFCRSCCADLTRSSEELDLTADREDSISIIENAYRSAVLPGKSHLQTAADRELRRFVEDMLRVLQVVFSSPTQNFGIIPTLSIPRCKLVRILAQLLCNAIPRNGRKCPDANYRRGLVLWSTLFQVICESEWTDLQGCFPYWPAPLRRRFVSALQYRRRKRWPYKPYSSQMLSLGFKCQTFNAVFDLSDTQPSQLSKSRI